ncbi:hypothetical protein [Aquipseudomonas alcaligenes]|jgi:hypothetical protein|uniref:hypothetical protein n=1 Tax=Aquipseudomonas alcaligenes TaxID=43263 RepID=UPI000970B844|nr:hypothetical protein [Pseudomonas alcaligenes]
MSNAEKLIELEFERDHSKRNALALNLAQSGCKEALPIILDLISNPELENHRGTLVHCLSFFDLAPHFLLLIDLQIKGNWEVAHEASNCLVQISEVSGDEASAARKSLEECLKVESIEDWRKELISELLEMFE